MFPNLLVFISSINYTSSESRSLISSLLVKRRRTTAMTAAVPIVDSMTGLLTPTFLFCIVNLVIGTIFIASRLKSHQKPDPAANSSPPNQNQLVQAPSFLQRVKSFNFSSYISEQPDPFHAVTQKSDPREEQEQEQNNVAPNSSPPNQNQLVRIPSFLDRVKSFNFSSYVSEQPDPFHAVTQKSDPREEQQQGQEQNNLAEEEVLLESHHHDDQKTKSKSERRVEAPGANGGPARARRMKKSLSEKAVAVVVEQEEVDRQRPATVRERKGRSLGETETETFGEEEAVDKKADDFINRFRQQLKLQRLDSILRYKEMLNRGLGLES